MQALPSGPAPAPRRQMLVGSTLGSMAMLMLTGGMIAVWMLQRTRHIDLEGTWKPSNVTIPEVASNVMLIAFLAIGTFAQWAVYAAKRGDRAHTVFALGATAFVGVLIINAQAFIYHSMGLGISDGTYAAMFYAITGMFVVVMIIGLVFSTVAAFRYLGGRDETELLSAHAIYWYATSAAFAAIWFVVYVTK